MSNERNYGAVQVIGQAGGMNQLGWEGAIQDSECAYLYNMSTSVDGEWRKRKGYFFLKQMVIAQQTDPTITIHWHTDEITDQADGSGWLETGDETNATTAGALDCSAAGLRHGNVRLGGEDVGYIDVYSTTAATAKGAYVSFKSANNLAYEAGLIQLNFNIYDPTKTSTQWTGISSSVATIVRTYLFYGSANFNIYISYGRIYWKYGSADSEVLSLGGTYYNTWNRITVWWDNTAGHTVYPAQRYKAVMGAVTKTADPSGAVSSAADSFGTDVFLFNTATNGTSAPCYQNMLLSPGSSVKLSRLTIYDSSSASAVVSPAITGIHNNSSQQRAIITAGVAASPAGKIYYSPNWTLATGTHVISGTRTSSVECQGNICIVDNTTSMRILAGSATEVTSHTLPETAKWVEEYHGHLWIAGLGTSGAYSVRCSIIDPDWTQATATEWPSTNQIIKCRDVVRGIKAFQGQLVVGTRSTIESITGYNPHDFAKTIVATANCASHWSMKEVPMMDSTAGSALIWAGYDGIYMMAAQNVTKISWPIQKFWDTLSKTEIEESHAVDCRTNGEYMLAVSDGSTTDNNYVIVYNYRKQDWSIWKYAEKMDVLGKYYRNGQEIILGGTSGGSLYEINRGESDNGAAINGYMLTKWFDGGNADQEKDFRKLYVWVAPMENYDVEIGWSADYAEGVIEPSIVVGTDGNDYECISEVIPSAIVGQDGNDYICSTPHTSDYNNKPGVVDWQADTAYEMDDMVTDAGYVYMALNSGTSGSSKPTFDNQLNHATLDNDIYWGCFATSYDASTYWDASGTVGMGLEWQLDYIYNGTSEKKPITGADYATYFIPRNTIGIGETWSATGSYHPASVSMQNMDSLTIDTESALFGTAVFGTDVFGSGKNTKMFSIDLYNARGKSIQFMFRNANADEPFQIRGFKSWYTYVPEFPA